MLTIGIFFALLSAVTHAVAHATLKGGKDKLVIRGMIAAVSGLAMAPLALFTPLPSEDLWLWLLLAGAIHTIYQLVLIRAYEAADFSIAYPLARGVVPIATGFAGIVFLGDRVSIAAVIGIFTVTAGLLLVAGSARIGTYGRWWALVAGLLTTIYTVTDGYAIRLAPHAMTFIIWFFLFDAFFMVPIVVIARNSQILNSIKIEGFKGLFAGLASLITYSSALIAFLLLPIGTASALRETSIIFGLLISHLYFKEKIDARRRLGTLTIAAGGTVIVMSHF